MLVAFDYETTSPKRGGKFFVVGCQPVGYSVSKRAGEALYAPHTPPVSLLEREDIEWIAHNAVFEYIVSRGIGARLSALHDTKLMAYLLQYESTSLKPLTKQKLGIDPITYKEVAQGRDMKDIPPEEVYEYGASDSDHTIALYHILRAELEEWGLWTLYDEIERPLISIVGDAMIRGVAVDYDHAQWAYGYFYKIAQEIKDGLYRDGVVPWGVNINSGEQLAKWLAELGCPIRERTESKGLLKTDRNALESVREWHPRLIGDLLSYREKLRLCSFVEGFIQLSAATNITPSASPVYIEHVLHGSINHAGHHEGDLKEVASEAPRTGRLSMSSPNLQQIPHHGRGKGPEYEGYGKIIRGCIIARPGYVLVEGDLAQQEPRITALAAPEPALIEDFLAGIPIYAPMGELIYERPIDKRMDEPEWHTAKTFFLASVYGCAWNKLLEIDPRMTEAQARRGYEAFHERYTMIKAFYEETKELVNRDGYVRDLYGRIRWFPPTPDPRQREAQYREAANFRIQGPGASMMKIAIARLQHQVRERGLDAHFVIPIHDAAIFEVYREDVDEFIPMMYNMTEGLLANEYGLTFPVEVQVGHSLGDMNEVD